MHPLEDRLVLERLRSDDRTALHAIFSAQYEPVCRVIRRFIVDPALVEDLAQEVFVRFWEKRAEIEITSNLPAYLRRMAVNEALAHLRRKTRFAPDELPEHLPGFTAAAADEQLQAGELRLAIRQAIDELPPRCKAVFQLSRFEEMSYQEIADQLDISIKTVENQMGKALRLLRDRLRQYTTLVLAVVLHFLGF